MKKEALEIIVTGFIIGTAITILPSIAEKLGNNLDPAYQIACSFGGLSTIFYSLCGAAELDPKFYLKMCNFCKLFNEYSPIH